MVDECAEGLDRIYNTMSRMPVIDYPMMIHAPVAVNGSQSQSALHQVVLFSEVR